jgi:hypothetical protein
MEVCARPRVLLRRKNEKYSRRPMLSLSVIRTFLLDEVAPDACDFIGMFRPPASICFQTALYSSPAAPLTSHPATWPAAFLIGAHSTTYTPSSFSPVATIFSEPSGKGRCSFKASSASAVIQVSISVSVVRMTGIALGWMAPTSVFGSQVKKPNNWCSPSTGLALVPRTPCHVVQIPGKKASGRVWSMANQVGVFLGLVLAYSQNDVQGTTQRCWGLSQARQCGLPTLRILVIGAPPKAGGPGMPQRSIASSRAPSTALRTTGAE